MNIRKILPRVYGHLVSSLNTVCSYYIFLRTVTDILRCIYYLRIFYKKTNCDVLIRYDYNILMIKCNILLNIVDTLCNYANYLNIFLYILKYSIYLSL